MARTMPPTHDRKRQLRETKQKVIIACEGIRTEKVYFEAIKRHLRLPSVDIRVYHAGGTNPGAIVNFVNDLRAEFKTDRTWGTSDQLWAVYDGIEHYRNNPSDWHKAISVARAKQVNLAITNPCFEFWYFIHFQDQNAWIERDVAMRLLKSKHLPEYDKAMCYYPDPLGQFTSDAISRAKQLVLQAQRDDHELPHCLCAEGVANLVSALLELAL